MSNRWEWQEQNATFAPAAAAFADTAIADDRGDIEAEVDLDLVQILHQRLIAEIDPKRLAQLEHSVAYDAVINAARRTLAEVGPNVVGEMRDLVLDTVADELLGLGPIEKLVKDPAVSEI